MGDGEVLLGVIGLAGRQVVIGVGLGGDEVRCADRLPEEVQAVAGRRVEQEVHGGIAG